MKNLITDVSGLRVGNAQDDDLKSGTTAVLCDVPNVASVHVMGGAPGTRDTDLLQPENTVQSVDGFVLSGGSAFGLDAAGGAQSWLRSQGKGFQVGDQRVPIVPAAILFDLINGGKKDWGLHAPYRELGYQAAQNAADDFSLGSVGAGTGALTGGPLPGLKGGLGSASAKTASGYTVGALVAVNALGSPVIGDTKHFWASAFEQNAEFGDAGLPDPGVSDLAKLNIKFRQQPRPQSNTTIGIVATDAPLTKGEVKRLTIAAHDGFARAIWPSHLPLDGDLIFGVSTGLAERPVELEDQIDLSATAASTMSRAIARGVFEAREAPNDLFPSWAKRFTAD
ncbi:MAG: P1 family peptidase [Pseudomonadota bacterium]